MSRGNGIQEELANRIQNWLHGGKQKVVVGCCLSNNILKSKITRVLPFYVWQVIESQGKSVKQNTKGIGIVGLLRGLTERCKMMI